MFNLLLILSIILCWSCNRQTRPPITLEKPLQAGADQNPNFSGQYELEGIPRFYHSDETLSLSFNHTYLKSITYSYGTPECDGKTKHHNPDEILEINLPNIHGEVRLCLTTTDINDEAEGKIHVYKWIQGYPDIINHTLESDCTPYNLSDVVAVKAILEINQEPNGGDLSPRVYYNLYKDEDCNISGFEPFFPSVDYFILEGANLYTNINKIDWELRIVFNESQTSIDHLEQVIGPEGTAGRQFIIR